jgi:DNA replication ATP-dependent helicase Dna2
MSPDTADALAALEQSEQLLNKERTAVLANLQLPKPMPTRALYRVVACQWPEEVGALPDSDVVARFRRIRVVECVAGGDGVERDVLLADEWAQTPVSVGQTLVLLGSGGDGLLVSEEPAVISNAANFVVVYPEVLVRATAVGQSFSCQRRAVLQESASLESSSSVALYGSLLHQLFQDAMQARNFTVEYLTARFHEVIGTQGESLLGVGKRVGHAQHEFESVLPDMIRWYQAYCQPASRSSPAPKVAFFNPGEEKDIVYVSHCLEVEESIVDLRFGLKGKIDAVLVVDVWDKDTTHRLQNFVLPFELKTGRRTSASRLRDRAQVMLYALMMSGHNRRQDATPYGMLMYLRECNVEGVRPERRDAVGLISRRNELAVAMRDPPMLVEELPPMLQSRSCRTCSIRSSCFLYHRVKEDGTADSSGLPEEFALDTGHMSVRDATFFRHWDNLLGLEERRARQQLARLWSDPTNSGSGVGGGFRTGLQGMRLVKASRVGMQFRYEFRRASDDRDAAAGRRPLMATCDLSVGDLVVVALDGTDNRGFDQAQVRAMTHSTIVVACSDRVRIPNLAWAHASTNMGSLDTSSSSSMSQGWSMDGSRTLSDDLYLEASDFLLANGYSWRLDKAEILSGYRTQRRNLIKLMVPDGSDEQRTRLARLKDLVIGAEAPRTVGASGEPSADADRRALAVEKAVDLLHNDPTHASLNEGQRVAVERALRSLDYHMIQGFPGSGKSSTLAHLVVCAARVGLKVLLSSQTHAAIDVLLTKTVPLLEATGVGRSRVVRISTRASAVDKDLRDLVPVDKSGSGSTASPEELEERMGQALVCAVTCLGVRSDLLANRSFDLCIVDEASQATLPQTLGPILLADSFILVGDLRQLQPVVRSPQARLGGLNLSLMETLHEMHPDACSSLVDQYRMCDEVVQVANVVTYEGRLRCATQQVADRRLALSLSQLEETCVVALGADAWLSRVCSPATPVVFVDTDNLPTARDNRAEGRTGDAPAATGDVFNLGEASLVSLLVRGLVAGGVAPDEIGVVTPYRGQVKAIIACLARLECLGDSNPVEVHTVDRYQGRDKEVIIVSLVRSNETQDSGGLLKDRRRVNVAVTRARTKLIIVGSGSMCAAHVGTPVYSMFQHCVGTGTRCTLDRSAMLAYPSLMAQLASSQHAPVPGSSPRKA